MKMKNINFAILLCVLWGLIGCKAQNFSNFHKTDDTTLNYILEGDRCRETSQFIDIEILNDTEFVNHMVSIYPENYDPIHLDFIPRDTMIVTDTFKVINCVWYRKYYGSYEFLFSKQSFIKGDTAKLYIKVDPKSLPDFANVSDVKYSASWGFIPVLNKNNLFEYEVYLFSENNPQFYLGRVIFDPAIGVISFSKEDCKYILKTKRENVRLYCP